MLVQTTARSRRPIAGYAAALAAVVLALIGAGNGAATAQTGRKDSRRAVVAAGPDVRATRTLTSFDPALACMDGLLLQYGKHDIPIINDGVPDATETLKVGTRDMVISALDAMSLRSNAFRYIDADIADQNVVAMQNRTQNAPAAADYYIKGSISQIDQDVISGGKKAGVALDFLSIGKAKDRSVTNISLELGMYKVADRTLIRGVRAQNTMQVVRSGSSTDLGGLLPFASVLFEVHQDRVQGSHQTVRTLIDLSLIELIGKFTKVPYWRCLSLPAADPAARRAAEEFYSRMKPAEQVTATQSALSGGGDARYYAGPINGVMSPALAEAIARYRVTHGLGAGPHIDFELYYSFLTKDLVADGDRLASGRAAPALAEAPLDSSLTFEMTTPAVVQRGNNFRVSLKPSRDAYFFCYMGGKGSRPSDLVAYRVYPNKFSGDQPMTPAGSTLLIPADENQFSIQFNDLGIERIACIARERRYDAPPPSAARAAFTEIGGYKSMPGLDVVINEHQMRDRNGMSSTVQVRDIAVVEKSTVQ